MKHTSLTFPCGIFQIVKFSWIVYELLVIQTLTHCIFLFYFIWCAEKFSAWPIWRNHYFNNDQTPDTDFVNAIKPRTFQHLSPPPHILSLACAHTHQITISTIVHQPQTKKLILWIMCMGKFSPLLVAFLSTDSTQVFSNDFISKRVFYVCVRACVSPPIAFRNLYTISNDF